MTTPHLEPVGPPRLRPLVDDDIDGLEELPLAAFSDLAVRSGQPPVTWDADRRGWWQARIRHLLVTDPDRQWVSYDGSGAVTGLSAASVREGLWGLSLLVVRPGLQSVGTGRALMAAALGGHTGPGVICASGDARALRTYAAAGFTVHPALAGSGRPDVSGYRPDPRVHDGVDRGFADAVDRAVRGSAHGPDHDFQADRPGWALRFEDGPRRAYASATPGGWVSLVAGTEPAAALAVLMAALARCVETGVDASVDHVTGGQPWAQQALVATRLTLRVDGAVCWRGRPEPTPYIPHGAFL